MHAVSSAEGVRGWAERCRRRHWHQSLDTLKEDRFSRLSLNQPLPDHQSLLLPFVRNSAKHVKDFAFILIQTRKAD